MSNKIFINYRVDDTQHLAAHLAVKLRKQFGDKHIFFDIHSLYAGDRFEEKINASLRECGVFLALIGKKWLDYIEKRRAQEQTDYVRAEIRAALLLGIPIIPVLEQGAQMPAIEKLPKEIQGLMDYSFLELSETRFDYDVAKLIQAIKKRLRPKRFKRLGIIIIALVVLITGAPAAWYFGHCPAEVEQAWTFMNSGYHDQAEQTLQQVRGLNRFTRAHAKGVQVIKLHHAVNSTQNPSVVKKKIQAFQQKYPQSPQALLLLGHLCVNDDPQTALNYYKKAKTLNPRLAEAWFGIGYIHAAYGNDPLQAVAPYQNALAIDPDNIRYRTNLAGVYAQTGDYAKAVKQYQKLINAHENALLNYIEIITCLRLAGHLDKAQGAASLLAAQLKNDQIFQEPDNRRPWYFKDLNQKPLVIKSADEKRYYAHLQIALTHFLAGARADAETHVRRAQSINPPDPQFLEGLIDVGIQRLSREQPDFKARLAAFQREFY